MKSIQSIAKQSSKVAQQRLMKSVNDAAIIKKMVSQDQAGDRTQGIIKNMVNRKSSMSIKQTVTD